MATQTNPIVKLSHIDQIRDALAGLVETALTVPDSVWAKAIDAAATNRPTDSGRHAQKAIESIKQTLDTACAELTRILCIIDSNQPPSQKLELIKRFIEPLRTQLTEQMMPFLTGRLSNVSYIITGNHPTREITTHELFERNEPRWLVGFQRGFERLELLVTGDSLNESDVIEAATEFLQKNYPDSIKKDTDEEEVHVERI